MQYYRLWIYSCNVVLAVTSTIFIIFAAFVVADFRLTLLEGVELYHPTFFYAYGALILQCGVVQTIGCLGAQRLSHKLLSLYWTLLLLLTLGDVGVGLYWVFHLEKVKVNLRPYLSREFIAKYSTDETFTLTWNKIQSQERCCGVDGPFDFERFPTSHHSKQAAFSANSHVIVDVEQGILSLPESCCTLLYAPATVSSSSSSGTSLDKTYHVSHYPPEEERPLFGDQSPEPSIIPNDEHYNHHPRDAGGGGRGGGRRSRTVISLPHKNDEPRSHLLASNEQEDTEQPAVEGTENGDEEDDNDDEEADEMAYRDGYLGDDNDSHNKNVNNFKTPYYLDFFHQSRGPLEVVPDGHDDDDHHHRDIQTPGPNHLPSDSTVQKRDIMTYEPIHAHKVRHELHRKSQSSPLIDVNSLKNTTSVLVLEKENVTTEYFQENSTSGGSSGENSRSKSSSENNSSNFSGTEKRNKTKKIVHEEGVVDIPRVIEKHYSRQNFNKTNKLFPSISFRVRRERRETRALLLSSTVTQVPAVSSVPPIQRHLVCHGQPEGLNHHNSYKKDLLDQRKTTKGKKEARAQTSSSSSSSSQNAKKVGAAWMYRKTTRTSADSAEATTPPTTFASHPVLKSTSAKITYKMGTNKIEELTKSLESTEGGNGDDDKSLLAVRKLPRVMSSSSHDDSSTPYSSKLTSFLPLSRRKKSIGSATAIGSGAQAVGKHGLWPRQKRIADMKAYSSFQSPNLQSDPRGISKNSHFASKEKVDTEMDLDSADTFAEPYFYPLSSSSAVSSSSTSYLEVNSPHATIISSSSTPYDQWNESNNVNKEHSNDNDDSSNASKGNGTSVPQKRLYVYGVGCGVKLIEWVDHVSGIMFILGFCIIGFAKTCFLVILRTEIREMIEKIHMIEPEEVLSPSRTHSAKDGPPRFHHVSHPLLQNPHRSSTVSAHGMLLPTIKSPDGPSSSCMPPSGLGVGYNRPNRHYLRRASNIVGGDRSRSHSNETVNMTLLMTGSQGGVGQEKGRSNPNLPTSAGGSSGTIANIEEKDPVSGLSITVPNSSSSCGVTPSSSALGAARYLRRSSTCSSSANPVGYPYTYGFEGEPRAGPSSRFYQYFEPLYQPTHLYQQHHHHHYTRNRSHSRNMSCGAILPLTSYRTNSAAAAASAAMAASYRGNRNLSSATTATTTTTSIMPNSTGCSFSSNSKDETEMVISVSLEHIASSDQDEEVAVAEEEEAPTTSASAAALDEEDVKDQEKKEWAAATSCVDGSDKVKSAPEGEDSVGTKLQTFSHSESANESGSSSSTGGGGGGVERDFQRRNGNNNVDLTNALPMSYIGTAV